MPCAADGARPKVERGITAAKINTMLRLRRGDEGLHAAEHGAIGDGGAAMARRSWQ
jgi:hypothetical protein